MINLKSFISKNSEFAPFEHILSNELPFDAYDEENQLFYNKDTISFCIESNPLTGANEEVIKIMNNLLVTAFPEGCILQVHLFASTKIGSILEKWTQNRQNDNPIFNYLTESRAEYLSKSSYNSLHADESLLLRDFRLFFSVIFHKDESENSLREILLVREQLISSLRTLSVPCVIRNAQEFISILREWISPNENIKPEFATWNKLDPLNIQISGQPKPFEVKSNRIQIGQEYEIRPLVVEQYPQQWPLWGMQGLIGDVFHANQSIRCPFYSSFCVYFPSQTGQRDRATLKSTRWRRLHESPIRRFLPITGYVTQEWEKVNQKIALGEKYVWVIHTLVLYCRKGEGDKVVNSADNLYSLNGWKLKPTLYTALPVWLASLPMSINKLWIEAMYNLGFAKTMLHSSAGQLLPVIAESKGTPDPNLLLVGRRGQLFGWDPFHNEKAGGNFNVCVVGKPGSGKSVVMQEIQLSILSGGGRIWVVDIGRSAQKTCEFVGGQLIDFAPNSNICINPFSDLDTLSDDDIKMLKPLIINMALKRRNPTDLEESLIEEAINAVWKDYGDQSSISLIAEWLESSNEVAAKELGRMLYPYTLKGMYGRLWNGKNTVNFDNPYVLLELDNLESAKDLQTVVLLAYLHRVSNALFLGDRSQRKQCVMDEVWALLNGCRVTEFIQAFARRARKHNGSIMLGTQDISDFFSSQAGEISYRISDWLIMLQQKGESIDRFIEKGQKKVEPYQEKLMKSLRTVNGRYSEMMICGDNWYAVGKLLLDPFSQILYSSKAQEFQAVQDLRNKGVSLPEAISIVSQRMQNG
ncbi:MAG: type-IV secretion system protein TraC [Gammaproteobacteria bacterium 39-13]|nr:MAG: type-IV secretion system protein TraC [Gammaproteobacteria bacterium 39-13]